ncbi:MAG TPA: virulence-associated E family protein [Polyangiaceae bacterium]|nr:virulence-associated E family protein [Polyangiaceae bacterium]
MTVANIDAKRSTAWRGGLILTKKEKTPKKCLANVLHVLAKHPEWHGVIAFDAFAEAVVCLKEPPTREQDRPQGSLIGDWTDEDSARTVAWISSNCEFEPSVEMVEQAILAIGRKHEVHPVRDYLDSLKWDAVQRLPTLLVKYFGATDTPYVRAVGTKWMISAVARAYKPGCQADYMLVLEGEQGIGKSTGVRVLGGDFYADTGIVVGDKDSYQALRRIWIYEFAELAAIKGRESERVKNFVSSRQDHYRPSYGRRTRDFPRQCVFCGSTNETQYLPDRTGNRRFWPVRCGRVDVAALVEDRDQLWAEAVARFKSGEAWHSDTAELVQLCQDEQADRQAPDDWISIVAEWLKAPTLPNGQHERRILDISDGITTADVLLGAIGMRAAEINNGPSTRAGHVLRDLGYKPSTHPVTRDGKRVRVYRCTAGTPENSGCAGEGVQTAQQQLGLK